uniref:Uncharacterized protein n=1 Tax=Quercus lobata TaxID=97700 RepID=A0A7N2R2J7_QUELO
MEFPRERMNISDVVAQLNLIREKLLRTKICKERVQLKVVEILGTGLTLLGTFFGEAFDDFHVDIEVQKANDSIGKCQHDLDESLPGQVRALALFRGHRVTTISDGAAEFVYQATVSISGHVFSGYLYDQGFDEKNAFPSISQLHLVSSGSGRKRDASSSPIVAPSNTHPAPVS